MFQYQRPTERNTAIHTLYTLKPFYNRVDIITICKLRYLKQSLTALFICARLKRNLTTCIHSL